jgi:cardiolipin synthase
MLWTLPNILTMARVASVPLMVAAFYLPGSLGVWVPLALFVAASVTDFLDGWLARALNQTSAFGRFLDPIADKLLVAAALIMLLAVDRVGVYSAIAIVLILSRELMIAGLREFLAGGVIAVPVSWLAKWKTAVQMVAIAVLIAAPALPPPWRGALIGEILLWAAAALTVITGYSYLKTGVGHILAADRPLDKSETGRS